MNRLEILSEWTTDNMGFLPTFCIDYPSIPTQDVTGTPGVNLTPAPNQLVLEVLCDDAALAAIEADPNYFVLSSEVIDETA